MDNIITIFSNDDVLAEKLKRVYFNNSIKSQTLSLEVIPNSAFSLINLGQYFIFIIDPFRFSTIENLAVVLDQCVKWSEKSYKSLFVFPIRNYPDNQQKIKELVDTIGKKTDTTVGFIFMDYIVENNKLLEFGVSINTFKENEQIKTNNNLVDCDWLLNKITSLTFSMKAYGFSTGMVGSSKKNLIEHDKDAALSAFNCDQLEICPVRTTPVQASSVDLKAKENQKESKNSEGLNQHFSQVKSVGLALPQVRDQASEINVIKKPTRDKISPVEAIPKTLTKLNIRKFNFKEWLKSHKKQNQTPTFNRKKSKNSGLKYKILIFLLLTSLVLFLPLILYYFSVSAHSISGLRNVQNYPKFKNAILNLSSSAGRGSLNLAEKGEQLPAVGFYYKQTALKATQLNKLLSLALEANNVELMGLEMFNRLVNGEVEQMFDTNSSLTVALDSLQNKLGFMLAESKVNNDVDVKVGLTNKLNQIKSYRSLLNQSESILGMDLNKKYAIIIENEKTLAGGGQVGALGVIEFSKGRINSFTVYNNAELDKALVGEIETPNNFEDYFNKNEWSIKNINWFSDFSIGARHAYWFIEKQLGDEVDGVISFNQNFIESLNETGNKYLPIEGDYKKFEITNLGADDNTVNEFEKVLNKLMSPDSYKDKNIASIVIKHLNAGNLKFYTKDLEVQTALVNIGWGGSFKLPNCDNGCYTDLVGMFLISKVGGLNKLNKEISVEVAIEEGVIKKRLTIFVENDSGVENSTIYRTVATMNAGFSPIIIVSESKRSIREGSVSTVGNFKENQLEVELAPDQTKAISFHWEQPFTSSSNRYVMQLVKQPGIQYSAYSVTLKVPPNYKIDSTNQFTLTNEGLLVYNTNLLTDEPLEISWQSN